MGKGRPGRADAKIQRSAPTDGMESARLLLCAALTSFWMVSVGGPDEEVQKSSRDCSAA